MALRNLLFLFCCVVLVSACSNAPSRPQGAPRGDYAYTRDYLSWFIDKQRSKHQVPGLSIALVDGKRVVWSRGFGTTRRDAGQAVDGDTVFRTASLSQVVTAALALRLQQQGRVDLDRPLSHYLPNLPAPLNEPGITLRRLLSHHAGLPLTWLAGRHQAHVAEFSSVAQALAGQALTSEPGTTLAYSELGFDLAGMVIEQAAGEDFAAYARQALLHPLGMDHSAFSPTPAQGPQAALGYTRQGAATPFALRDLPALGLNSSANDLARLLSMLNTGDGPLGAAQIQAMLSPQNTGVALDLDYRVTLGWFQQGEQAPDGSTVLVINGVLDGNSGMMALMPRHHLAVVVLANNAAAPLYSIGRQALALMYEARTGERWKLDEKTTMAARDGASPDPALEGNFDTVAGFAHTRRDGDRLAVRLNGQPLQLRPLGDRHYALEHRLLGLFPMQLKQLALKVVKVQGREILAYVQNGRDYPIGEKLHSTPIPPAWRGRLGRYALVSPQGELAQWAKDGDIQLLERYGLLLAVVRHGGKIEQVKVLQVLDDQHARVAGLGSDRGEAVSVSRDPRGELAHYSGLSLRRVGPVQDPGL